jgi:hypothetical protein
VRVRVYLSVATLIFSLPFACLDTAAADDALQIFDGMWVSTSPPGPHIVFNKIGQTREASLPNLGQASIASSRGDSGSNYQISGAGFTCYYLILTTNARAKMVWELKSGSSGCFANAVFERVDNDGQRANATTPATPVTVTPTAPVQNPVPPPSAAMPRNLLETMAAVQWCTLKRTYSLQVTGKNVVWTDGSGSVDREVVVYNYSDAAQTITQTSVHPDSASEPVGTTWTYNSVSRNKIVVKSNTGKSFSLTRC